MNEAGRKKRPEFLEQLSDYEPTDAELAATTREEAERDERLDESALATNSEIASMLVHQWLENHREQAMAFADADLANAIDIASRDGFFIHVKLHRALDGRDRAMHGEGFDDHPIQNDWNGSAKIALICIVRSIRAWNLIACATGDSDARHIKELLTQLQQHVEREFPDAWKFIRPGFDGS
jgi:hypothetical protein